MNTGERFNPVTNSWSALPDMESPRSNFAIEVFYCDITLYYMLYVLLLMVNIIEYVYRYRS